MRSRQELDRFAQQMREHPTPAEAALAAHLCPDFHAQVVVGPFIADFASSDARIAVEVDGRVHRDDEQRVADERKDQWLLARGWLVRRFSNEAVLERAPTIALRLKHEQVERLRRFSEANLFRREVSDALQDYLDAQKESFLCVLRFVELGVLTSADLDRYQALRDEEADYIEDCVRTQLLR